MGSMLTVHANPEFPMDRPRSAVVLEVTMDQRVVASRARARRRWVFQTILTLSITAILLCFLVVYRRDQLTIADQVRSMDDFTVKLQEQVKAFEWLPGRPPQWKHGNLGYYASDAERRFARETSDSVIVAAGQLVPLLFKEGGRVVVSIQKGKIECRWMSGTEFRQKWAAQQDKLEKFEESRRAKPIEIP